MSDLEHARRLLGMAEKDLRAVRGMSDVRVFADEIVGFHAQQAIEKTLKAWIASRNENYPLVHNIARLLAILEENGCEISPFWDLVEYTAYAVAFRYDAVTITEEPLDRAETFRKIQQLFDHVHHTVSGE